MPHLFLGIQQRRGPRNRFRTWADYMKWPTPGAHEFSKNLGATSQFWAPDGYHERSSIPRICKHQAPQQTGARDLCAPGLYTGKCTLTFGPLNVRGLHVRLAERGSKRITKYKLELVGGRKRSAGTQGDTEHGHDKTLLRKGYNDHHLRTCLIVYNGVSS